MQEIALWPPGFFFREALHAHLGWLPALDRHGCGQPLYVLIGPPRECAGGSCEHRDCSGRTHSPSRPISPRPFASRWRCCCLSCSRSRCARRRCAIADNGPIESLQFSILTFVWSAARGVPGNLGQRVVAARWRRPCNWQSFVHLGCVLPASPPAILFCTPPSHCPIISPSIATAVSSSVWASVLSSILADVHFNASTLSAADRSIAVILVTVPCLLQAVPSSICALRDGYSMSSCVASNCIVSTIDVLAIHLVLERVLEVGQLRRLLLLALCHHRGKRERERERERQLPSSE